VDLAGRRLILDAEEVIPFDYFVLAAGSVASFFGLADVEAASRGLKDLSEALALRNHILSCFEKAARLPDAAARAPWLTFVIVGGGPTGVEYAGALAELAGRALARDYPEFDIGEVRIVVVEAQEQLLPSFPPPLAAEGISQLEQRRVRVALGTRIVGVSEEEVRLSTGERLRARTLVWAAGVRPADLAAAIDVPRTRGGRIEVDPFLRLPGHEHAFAIGDVAAFTQDGAELPMLAAPAQQQGRHVAANLWRIAAGRELLPFRYRDRGTMATIGRNAAVAEIGRVHLKGFIGWVAWLFLHLYLLIGFRNRLMVLIEWAWEYLHYDRPVRIIARAKEESPSD